jgi:hypothetical protein
MIEPDEEKRGEWTRVIAVRISEDMYREIKRTRIKIAPYIRTIIKDLIRNEQETKKVWKKR